MKNSNIVDLLENLARKATEFIDVATDEITTTCKSDPCNYCTAATELQLAVMYAQDLLDQRTELDPNTPTDSVRCEKCPATMDPWNDLVYLTDDNVRLCVTCWDEHEDAAIATLPD